MLLLVWDIQLILDDAAIFCLHLQAAATSATWAAGASTAAAYVIMTARPQPQLERHQKCSNNTQKAAKRSDYPTISWLTIPSTPHT
jgi:hypothetical protein